MLIFILFLPKDDHRNLGSNVGVNIVHSSSLWALDADADAAVTLELSAADYDMTS